MIDVNKLKNKLSELENLQDLLANNTISPEQYKYKAEHIISQCREKRDILVAFAPSVLFPIAVIVLGASLWFDFRDIYPLKWIVIDPLKWINADHTAGLLCTSTIPRVLGSLYVFMAGLYLHGSLCIGEVAINRLSHWSIWHGCTTCKVSYGSALYY